MPGPYEPVAPFGATVEGVVGLLPRRDWTTGNPSMDDVPRFLGEITNRMVIRLGIPASWPDYNADGSTGLRATLIAAAAHLAHHGAAAMVQDAGNPEQSRADTTDDSYGAVLWRRYETGLAELEVEIERGRGHDEAGVGGAGWAFPLPFGWSTVRW